jgi:hypothetical protein
VSTALSPLPQVCEDNGLFEEVVAVSTWETVSVGTTVVGCGAGVDDEDEIWTASGVVDSEVDVGAGEGVGGGGAVEYVEVVEEDDDESGVEVIPQACASETKSLNAQNAQAATS